MTDKMDRMLTRLVNLEDRQKEHIGRRALTDIFLYFREDYSYEEIMEWIINLTKLVVSADKKTMIKEHHFFCNVTKMNLDEDEFYELTNHGSSEDFVKMMMIRINDLPRRIRKAMVLYCSALAAYDDIINKDEIDLLAQIEPSEDEDDDED